MSKSDNPIRPHISLNGENHSPQVREYNGGGGGTYKRTSYSLHAKQIFTEAQQLQSVIQDISSKVDIKKVYYRVEVPSDISMWSGAGEKISDNLHAEIVASPSRHVGHLSSPINSFNLLVEQLTEYNNSAKNVGKSNFAALEKITAIPAAEKILERMNRVMNSDSFNGKGLLSFFPDLTKEELSSYLTAIKLYLEPINGKLLDSFPASDGMVVAIQATAEQIQTIAETFMAVQSVDPIDSPIVLSSTRISDIANTVTVLPNSSDSCVCIFDSGVVKGSRFLDASVRAWEEPLGMPYDVDHGTMVASRIIYGDSLRDQISAGTLKPDLKVLSVCLFSVDAIGNKKPPEVTDVLRVVRDTVQRWHSQIRVYNLSMNFVFPDDKIDSSIADDAVHALAAELDHLSRKYDVVFVISTGNYPAKGQPNPTSPYPRYFEEPNTRICPPAEALLAVTVGSIASRDNQGSMSRSGQPSPFTRRGPGFFQFPKPDVVAHGGNFGQNWLPFEDLSTVGIGKDGASLSYANGTSFAAPIISRLLAKVFEMLPTASASFARAMVIHFSDFPTGTSEQDFEKPERYTQLYGSGAPDSFLVSHSTPHAQTYVYDGEIDYRQILRIKFYVPTSLLLRKGKKLKLRATLAFAPETSKTLRTGYCKSHIRMAIWKLDKDGELKQCTVDDGPNVRKLPYSTMLRVERDFATAVTAGEWEIRLEQISRWSPKEPKTKFGLVITLFDPQEGDGIDIYSAIRTEVPNRFKNEIRARERIRI